MLLKSEDKGFLISEHPISNIKDDYFDVDARIVNKIFDVINNASIGQLTIAITSGYGTGKSSALNLLKTKLKANKNVVINFEPLLEGKFEIADIIGLFYLKLYKELSQSSVKDVIKKCLKSIAILSRAKITGNLELDASSIGISGTKVNVGSEYNLGDNVDALLDLWKTEKPDDFSEQTKKLNDVLIKNKYRLFIFIDEIDRLPANYIINFLLFCRILESFDNMVCIVGIDYEQVINKLMKESSLCLDDYTHAQGYLDKLFQIKHHIHHNRYKKIHFAIAGLRDLDQDNIFDEIIDSNDFDIKSKFEDIVDYLATPRQIKKWIMSIKINYSIIKHSKIHKINIIAFIAVTIKHPIIIDYLSKHTLRILNERWQLKYYIKNKYAVDFLSIANRDDEIIIASMGFMTFSNKIVDEGFDQLLKNFISKLRVKYIDDAYVYKCLINYLKTPEYLIALLVEGYIDEEQVTIYDKFFSSEINQALNMLAKDENNIEILAFDLADALEKGTLKLTNVADVLSLNELWSKKINESDLMNPYETIILHALRMIPIEICISSCLIGLSENHISNILRTCGINNINGVYNLSQFSLLDDNIHENGMKNLNFNGVPINDFKQDTIKQIISLWLKKVEQDLGSYNETIYKQPRLINAFCRYIQFSSAIRDDAREKLASYVVGYLKCNNISYDDQIYLQSILKNEIKKFNTNTSNNKQNLIEFLFNNDPEVIRLVGQ